MKGSCVRALSARLFLGTFRKKVNSNMSPYILGHRQAISILDLTNSVFRLQKFLLFLKCAIKQRAMLFTIFNPTSLSLSPALLSLDQSFSPKWIGGVLTNYASCCYFFLNALSGHYAPHKFPGALITENVYALNEARLTRTPSTFLADSASNVYLASYGIVGNCAFLAFKLLIELSVSAISQGLRAQKLSFGNLSIKFLHFIFLFFPSFSSRKTNIINYLFFYLSSQHLSYFKPFSSNLKIQSLKIPVIPSHLPLKRTKVEEKSIIKTKIFSPITPIIHNISISALHFFLLFKQQERHNFIKQNQPKEAESTISFLISKIVGTTDLNWHFLEKIRLSLTRLPNSADRKSVV